MQEYHNVKLNNNCYITQQIFSSNTNTIIPIDIVLIGAGIMSATLGMFIKILKPNWTINIYERLKKPAQESSNVWNNAGTGHAAFCELNYTTQKKDGSIDINKAIKINESFEISRQFWAFLVKEKILNNPASFINNVPHMSLVWGNNNIDFLRKRFQALQNSILFYGMTYSENNQEINKWIPLVMDGRNPHQKLAATRMEIGTDVNFGEIAKQLLDALQKDNNVNTHYNHIVTKIKRNNNKWIIYVTDNNNNNAQQKKIHTRHAFIGAGGASLPLLQTSGIKEIHGYAGFPVGGQFLTTHKQNVTLKHLAKVYGQAPIYGPPMSVPHLDTRIINGQQILSFGPFATFNSKFLKNGSWTDLFSSLNRHNLLPILQVGCNNLQLIQYLIKQLIMSKQDRFNALQEFYPQAKLEDWKLIQAGQRVQIIKKNINKTKKSLLQFGTELINSSDNTLFALLGASPGASIAVSIALELIHKIFKQHINTAPWDNKLLEIIPSYKQKLDNNIILTNKIRRNTCSILKLKNIEIQQIKYLMIKQ
ncbi:malate dehydrogenase (quinone) [Blochmannia endosymbiont of Camponotus (Colobopsis) obliquus]|uniref:malate dehydrogenase (quinone) n=1 Tax=Blochmannia endosymbiont of Camponotus (Colobopsis) obliquus TaxID=1505597 RepID=UPI00061A6ECC|nr:malate dehydrogenase (quinone) [Blochmannia endosymbiont of Camponotus (Colobopsis) obliquus]AKC60675.1 Malate:quinone oxidoreductase [Blochmannia endosymbiont of Camponotus (Colobopsis) obliquus]